jgi:hypothetical protein
VLTLSEQLVGFHIEYHGSFRGNGTIFGRAYAMQRNIHATDPQR